MAPRAAPRVAVPHVVPVLPARVSPSGALQRVPVVAAVGAEVRVKVSKALELLSTLPPDAAVKVTLELVDELAAPMTDAERAREYRKRKRSSVTENVTFRDGGVRGGSKQGSEKEAEKKGENGSTQQVDLGATVTKIVTRRDGTPEEREAVAFVFEAWRQDTGHHRAFLDRKRGARILARLREGKTKEDLVLAITNRRRDPFLMGQGKNTDGKVYDGIETLLRDAGQVERLMALGGPAGGPAPTEEQRERWRQRRAELDRMEAANGR